MSQKIEANILPFLDPDERLLWSGQTTRMNEFKPTDLIGCAFGIGGLACLSYAIVVSVRDNMLLGLAIFLPFILIWSLSGLSQPIVRSLRRRSTFYGLTERRALIVSGLRRKSVEHYVLANESTIELRETGGDTGTICFGNVAREGRNRPSASCFERVANAREGFQYIHYIQTEAIKRKHAAMGNARAL